MTVLIKKSNHGEALGREAAKFNQQHSREGIDSEPEWDQQNQRDFHQEKEDFAYYHPRTNQRDFLGERTQDAPENTLSRAVLTKYYGDRVEVLEVKFANQSQEY